MNSNIVRFHVLSLCTGWNGLILNHQIDWGQVVSSLVPASRALASTLDSRPPKVQQKLQLQVLLLSAALA